jgi:hypothetical protein
MQSRLMASISGDREDPRKRLAAIFGDEAPSSGRPPEAALRWARRVLADAAPSRPDDVTAIRLLRAEEPRLTLRAAGFLAAHALRGPEH